MDLPRPLPNCFTHTVSVAAAKDSYAWFRIRANVDGGDLGISQIDNIIVSGTAIVPAPGAIALLGIAGLLSRRRR